MNTEIDSDLFIGLSADDRKKFFEIIGGEEKIFKPKNIIYMSGSNITKFGIITEGKIDVINITHEGNVNLMFTLKKGDMVCESVCFTESKKIPFDIVAKTDAKIYFVEKDKLFSKNIMEQKFYNKLIQNFFTILAQENVNNAKKMDILSRRTTEDKVLTYLYMQSKLCGKKSFDIPFNREELATFLAVDRSALSTVIAGMNKKNIIRCKKNHFTLLK